MDEVGKKLPTYRPGKKWCIGCQKNTDIIILTLDYYQMPQKRTRVSSIALQGWVCDLYVRNAQAADRNRRCFLHRVDAETGKHIFRIQRKLPKPFLHPELSFCPCIKLFCKFHPAEHKPFFLGLCGGTVSSGNRHNKKNQNEFHAFIRSLIFKAQFHPCPNDNFFVRKDMLLKSLFGSCFQMENLIFLVISLI